MVSWIQGMSYDYQSFENCFRNLSEREVELMVEFQQKANAITYEWQKLCEGIKGLRRKAWTLTKILSPNIRYFVEILRFVAIYALIGDLWTKKVPFWVKNGCFLGKKCTIT